MGIENGGREGSFDGVKPLEPRSAKSVEHFVSARPLEHFVSAKPLEPRSAKRWESFDGEVTLIGGFIMYKGKAYLVAGAHAKVNRVSALNAPSAAPGPWSPSGSYIVELVIATASRKLILRGPSSTYKQAQKFAAAVNAAARAPA